MVYASFDFQDTPSNTRFGLKVPTRCFSTFYVELSSIARYIGVNCMKHMYFFPRPLRVNVIDWIDIAVTRFLVYLKFG